MDQHRDRRRRLGNRESRLLGDLQRHGRRGHPGALAGQFVSGLIKEGGKVAEGVANVVSSSLVGSVPGSFTTTESAYGDVLRPSQRQLQTAMPARGVGPSYGPFYGHNTEDVMQAINLNESIHQQLAFANRKK